MFYPVEGGSVYEIPDNAFGFVYKCQLPPVGYGVSTINGQVKEVEIFPRAERDEDNFWERPILPADFAARRKKEKEQIKINPKYVDPYLQEIRIREWKRRIYGIWFHNYNPKTGHVELRYITGPHYFYITYWKFQGKFMDFRITDMEWWYVARYIETDPDALGGNEITKRKQGKTARVGAWLYERTSRPPKNQHGGLQSKADDDAEEVMLKAIVQPWQKLPDFFRPIYDTMKGDSPKELRFFHPSRRGAGAEEERDEEDALESWIDFKSSDTAAYDGPELDTYVADEAGKTKKPVSILERQMVVRYCSELDGVMKGKQWYTTTVEIAKGEEDNYEFQEMTVMSNPMNRNDNNRTMTGLYTYFLPAHKGMNFDKYGYPDEEKSLKWIMNTVEKYLAEGKTREASSFKRKNPINIKWAFSVDGADSLYNPELLQEQLDNISWGDPKTERGNLKWVDGFEIMIEKEQPDGTKKWVPNDVYWESDPNGRYEKVVGWMPKEPNAVYEKNGMLFPNRSYWYRIGCDPFRYDKTKDKRRSNCAAFVYQMPDENVKNPLFDNIFGVRYAYRPDSGTREANMDILKMAWWCGSQVLFERNVNHWKEHFEQWKCSGFLMWMPGEVEPGVFTGGNGANGLVQTICNYTDSYINQHYRKVFFRNLLAKETGWLGFKVEDTEKFDEPMAAGITLLAVHGKRYAIPNQNTRDISSILPMNKAS